MRVNGGEMIKVTGERSLCCWWEGVCFAKLGYSGGMDASFYFDSRAWCFIKVD
jgi:hypothetical protein